MINYKTLERTALFITRDFYIAQPHVIAMLLSLATCERKSSMYYLHVFYYACSYTIA